MDKDGWIHNTNLTHLSLSGLHHLHGGPGRTFGLQGPRRGWHLPCRVSGPSGTVWSPVSPPVSCCHVQQRQQGRQPAVPHLQDYLRGQDGQSAPRQNGVPCHPPLTAGTSRLQNHPHNLQHPAWHSGKSRNMIEKQKYKQKSAYYFGDVVYFRALSTQIQENHSQHVVSPDTVISPTVRRVAR